MNKKYLSDILGEEFAELFEFLLKINHKKSIMPGVIQAPTGYGKSTFFKKAFCDYCRDNGYTAIMLLPRTAPIEEFANELKAAHNDDVLQLATYQHITATRDILDYDFIICDECHYFVTDAAFNRDTDICFELIHKSRGIKIFISATPEPFLPILDNYKDYIGFHHTQIEESENNNIKAVNLLPMHSAQQIITTVCNIMPTLPHKAIIFCSSAKDAHEIWKNFRTDALFVCSKDNEYYTDVDTTAYQEMLTKHKIFTVKFVLS